MKEDNDAISVACTLSDTELREREVRILAQFKSAVIGTEELHDGFAFRIPVDDKSIAAVAELIAAERECCRFLTFELTVAPNLGPVILLCDWALWHEGLPANDILHAGDLNEEDGTMPQVSAREFERLPLRVHAFMAGVQLHDVWAIDLPRWRTGVTLDEFLRTVDSRPHHSCACCSTSASSLDTSATKNQLFTRSPLVRMLLGIRFFVGQFFGWDREPAATTWETFATHLTDTDHSRSLAPAGTRDGFFRVVYRFENEQLVELVNRTAHAAALSALVETASAYRFYFGVYVRSVSRFTPLYMALVDPFRKLIVYPLLLRSVSASWNQAFGKR